MAWFKVDDKLWGHPKWLAVSPRARGLWVTAGSWCASNGTDGLVPTHVLRVLGHTAKDAGELVGAGLWHVEDGGWRFNDWLTYQPDAASEKAKHAAESEAGTLGNHRRWHLARNITVPDCPHCAAASGTRSGTQSGGDRVTRVAPESSRPGPDPNPVVQSPESGGEPSLRDPMRCSRHQGVDEPPACGACADARRREERRQEQAVADAAQARRVSSERHSATLAQERAAADAEAITSCDRCDDHGRTEDGTRCPHKPADWLDTTVAAITAKPQEIAS